MKTAYTREKNHSALFKKLCRVIEKTYGIPVRLISLSEGFSGDLNGAEIFINKKKPIEEQLFNVLHLFGHTVQWNVREDGYILGHKLFIKPKATLLKQLIAYEHEAARYGASLLVEADGKSALPWFTMYSDRDLRFVSDFYKTGSVKSLGAFAVRSVPLIAPLPIPPFMPFDRGRRIDGIVVSGSTSARVKIRKELSYEEYIEGTRKILHESQVATNPYTIKLGEREYVVHPQVFSPKYFYDTEFFAKNLLLQEGDRVLEVGPGTGVISIESVYKGASKVVAIDINPSAVANTEENIKLHHLEEKIFVRSGNVYSTLQDGEKFDLIFWNTPFGLLPEGTMLTDLEKSVYDPGYRSTETFIKGAHKHLAPNGRVVVGFSSTLGRLDLLKKFAKEARLSFRLIASTESVETHPVCFELFELRQTS